MYAQYLMGKLWRDGPLLIPDSVEARYWFEQAAEQGHLVAQYSLAKLYLSDDVEVRDTRQGMNWLYTAAVNGSQLRHVPAGQGTAQRRFDQTK